MESGLYRSAPQADGAIYPPSRDSIYVECLFSFLNPDPETMWSRSKSIRCSRAVFRYIVPLTRSGNHLTHIGEQKKKKNVAHSNMTLPDT